MLRAMDLLRPGETCGLFFQNDAYTKANNYIE